MSRHYRFGIVGAVLGLAAWPGLVQGETATVAFAAGQISVQVVAERGAIPPLALSALPLAMAAAVEHVGAPAAPATLTLRLLAPPSFYKRLKALFRIEAFAEQEDDEIRLYPGDDPLKLAFRLGHELAHWLVGHRHPARPPLWLDEGLAQLVGSASAETCARVHKQTLERPPPAALAKNLFTLPELTALADYPGSAPRSAAFYWQAEALVRAIHRKLGREDFAVYLGLLAAPHPPAWDQPLRDKWYFSDWDLNWLAEQIRPASPAP